MRKTMLFAAVLAAILTVGYFLVPKNESVNAAGQAVDEAEVEKIVKDFIIGNPEIIIESLNKYQAKKQEEEQSKASENVKGLADELKKNASLPVIGNNNGDVTVLEFFDYNCGYCKKVVPSVAQLIKEDSKVRVVLMELPILSEASEVAARAALAVYTVDKSKYFDFHRKVMEHNGNKNEEKILGLAGDVGLDKAKVKEAMKSEETSKTLGFIKDTAQKIGVRGTPAFVVGTKFIPGAVDYDTLKKAVEEARKGESK
jgi:protein-disulfide isomerase